MIESQTRLMSLAETIVGVVCGFLVAMTLWRVIVTPYLDIPVSYEKNFMVTTLFTVVSIVRTYTVRRIFNGKMWKRLRVFTCTFYTERTTCSEGGSICQVKTRAE